MNAHLVAAARRRELTKLSVFDEDDPVIQREWEDFVNTHPGFTYQRSEVREVPELVEVPARRALNTAAGALLGGGVGFLAAHAIPALRRPSALALAAMGGAGAGGALLRQINPGGTVSVTRNVFTGKQITEHLPLDLNPYAPMSPETLDEEFGSAATTGDDPQWHVGEHWRKRLASLPKTSSRRATRIVRGMIEAGDHAGAAGLVGRLAARGGLKVTPQGTNLKHFTPGAEGLATLVMGAEDAPAQLAVRKALSPVGIMTREGNEARVRMLQAMKDKQLVRPPGAENLQIRFARPLGPVREVGPDRLQYNLMEYIPPGGEPINFAHPALPLATARAEGAVHQAAMEGAVTEWVPAALRRPTTKAPPWVLRDLRDVNMRRNPANPGEAVILDPLLVPDTQLRIDASTADLRGQIRGALEQRDPWLGKEHVQLNDRELRQLLAGKFPERARGALYREGGWGLPEGVPAISAPPERQMTARVEAELGPLQNNFFRAFARKNKRPARPRFSDQIAQLDRQLADIDARRGAGALPSRLQINPVSPSPAGSPASSSPAANWINDPFVAAGAGVAAFGGISLAALLAAQERRKRQHEAKQRADQQAA